MWDVTDSLGAVIFQEMIRYQAWTYNLFKAKTTTKDLAYDDAY